jgi:hypothetical protein
MQGGGIYRGEHPPFFRIELHETVDGVDANQLDEQGRETKIETAEFSLLEQLLNCRVGGQRSEPSESGQ